MKKIDTAEKLANALRDFSPTINDEDVKVIFDDLNEGYTIGRIAEHKEGWVYDTAIKYIKKEFRHQFKVIYINLGYIGDFCPQDMPYQMLLIRTTTGEVVTPEQIIRHFKKTHKEKDMDVGKYKGKSVVVQCRKCGHLLYIDIDDKLLDRIKNIEKKECPSCGEEGCENWKLRGIDDWNKRKILY